jgi:hypothetical protein
MANPSRRPTQGLFVLRVARAGRDETTRYASLIDLGRAVARLVMQERARGGGSRLVGPGDTWLQSFGDSGRILRIAVRPDAAFWHRLTGHAAPVRYGVGSAVSPLEIEAFGISGRQLRLQGLIDAGMADLRRQGLLQRLGGRLSNWGGQGAVPGTGNRGRFARLWRPCRTAQERRYAAHVMHEEGEIGPRACRDTVLPEVWDDRHRPRIKCWKAQHKGRKAWDR